jgi:hypothetical protein
MISALFVALALSTSGGAARPTPRPPPRQAPKPKPPPPPPEDGLDEPEDGADVDDAPLPGAPRTQQDPPEDAPPSQRTDPDDDLGKLTDEQIGALTLMGGCCCFIFVGVLGLVIWLIVRKKPAQQAVPPPVVAPPPGFHLSVLALGLSAQARQAVAQQLLVSGVSADPVSAADRAHLVRELAKALRSNETAWTHFGYGEKTDLNDEGEAARSYQLAVDDFRKRSEPPSTSPDAGFVVATLVLCTRRRLRGVSALNDRPQIHSMLEDRSALHEGELMGALLVWSAPLADAEVLSRFPEMHAVR